MINSSTHRNEPILSVKGLKKHYGTTKAVDDVDFDIRPGEIVSIIGRSGAGKSTVMRCINRLVLPDAGSITFKGAEITNKMSSKQLREARSKIGFIF